ncbi:hypothetical protein, partial [Caldisericum sp.]|uniref:hypothetical protein n=1 Tax=Caldisericum sp. TaxID=2499687 RepID=UPI003D14EAD6
GAVFNLEGDLKFSPSNSPQKRRFLTSFEMTSQCHSEAEGEESPQFWGSIEGGCCPLKMVVIPKALA